MRVDRCIAEVNFQVGGFKTMEEAMLGGVDLTLDLGQISGDYFESDDRTFGFTVEATCDLWKDGKLCGGLCLKEALKRLGLEEKISLRGNCLSTNAPDNSARQP